MTQNMSNFALPARPQAQPPRSGKNNTSTTARPLKEHVNVYSVKQQNERGGKGRAGYKEDDLINQMGNMGLRVKFPQKPVTPPTSHPSQMQNLLAMQQSALDRATQLRTSPVLPQEAMAFMQLQQAQIEAASGNPELQAYLVLQAQAQRANLIAQLHQQQLEAQLLIQANPSTFMPPPRAPKAPTDRSAFAAQVQARTKAREAAAASAHTRSASLSSNGSSKTKSTDSTSPILLNSPCEDTSSKISTPLIRITPALPSQAHFASGLGRPSSRPSPRLASTPILGGTPKIPDAVRSVSQPLPTGMVRVLRQPNGPPAPAAELGDRNFQSCIRKKAGLKLGVLGRRMEATTE